MFFPGSEDHKASLFGQTEGRLHSQRPSPWSRSLPIPAQVSEPLSLGWDSPTGLDSVQTYSRNSSPKYFTIIMSFISRPVKNYSSKFPPWVPLNLLSLFPRSSECQFLLTLSSGHKFTRESFIHLVICSCILHLLVVSHATNPALEPRERGIKVFCKRLPPRACC